MPDKFGDKIRLQHILDAIAAINRYVSGADLQQLSENPMMQDACIRQLQIVGEAASKISLELRQK